MKIIMIKEYNRYEDYRLYWQKGAQTLYYAAEVAKYIYLPLNYFITINFSETDILPLQIICFFKI